MADDEDCLKFGGYLLGWYRSIVYGIMSLALIAVLMTSSSEDCKKPEGYLTNEAYLSYDDMFAMCNIPVSFIITFLIITSLWFIVHVLFLIGIWQGNQKLVQPAVVVQGIEFYILAGCSVLSIPILIINGAIVQASITAMTCILTYYIFNLLKKLYNIIKSENQENQRVKFDINGENAALNV